ncbi:MAG: beta-lactamase family protein [Bacteroidales bacterium]|nr:beta-lactamase family protein [Bacteroidales bacterium]
MKSRRFFQRYQLTLISYVTALALSSLIILTKSNLIIRNAINLKKDGESLTARYERIIPVLMEYYHIPGVCISVIKGGKEIWSSPFGYADVEKGIKMTTETFFRVESISKSVTAWGVSGLIEEGKIDPARPVEGYLNGWKFPEGKFSAEGITINSLLSHTSGLPLGDFTNRFSPAAEIPGLRESLSREAFIIREPGSSYSYSNVGFNLLQLVAEEVTGVSFSDYIGAFLLKPLGMSRSCYEWNAELESGLATAYDLKGNPVGPYVYPENGAGGLFSTIEDISKFVVAGVSGSDGQGQRLLSENTVAEMHTPLTQIHGIYGLVFSHYGRGHFIEYLDKSELAVSHGGQGYGWMSHYHLIPGTGDGIVILTNSQRSWPFFGFVLRDWAEWCGYKHIGMEVIPASELVLWLVVWTVMLISLAIILLNLLELFTGRRVFIILKKDISVKRLIRVAASVVIFIFLAWCSGQEYLFVSSLFHATTWTLGLTAAAVSLAILSIALTKKSPQKRVFLPDNKNDKIS